MNLARLLAFATIVWTASAVGGTVDLPTQVGGAFSVPAQSLREARFNSTVRQQYDFSCGSAALSTLLTHHYDFPIGEAQVFQQMYERGDPDKIKAEGFSLLDMKVFLEANGFEADGFEAPLDKLVSAGLPAIALVNEKGYNHFVVVKGVKHGRVLIGDPSGGTRSTSIESFNAVWVNQILFVVTNKQDAARFNLASDWRVAPFAPIAGGIDRTGASLPKLGPADF